MFHGHFAINNLTSSISYMEASNFPQNRRGALILHLQARKEIWLNVYIINRIFTYCFYFLIKVLS